MSAGLSYVIRFVADMGAATRFYRDEVGMTLRFESPDWTEFDTGQTTLALHPATADHPAGAVQLGLAVDDLAAFHAQAAQRGIVCVRPPADEHGVRIARYRDPEGAGFSVSERRR